MAKKKKKSLNSSECLFSEDGFVWPTTAELLEHWRLKSGERDVVLYQLLLRKEL